MITARLRTHPHSPPVPAKFELDRPLFSFASTYSRARTPSEVSVIGRGFLPSSTPPSPTRKKANTFNAPSLAPFVPLDRNCQTDICILAFLSVPISAQRANMLHREERGRGRGNKCQFGYTQWRQFAYNGRENIPPWPRRRRMKGANSIASPVTYTPLYRAAAAALKLTAAPPTTMLTPLLTTAATPPFAWE